MQGTSEAPTGNGFDVATRQEQQCEIQCECHSNCTSCGNTPSISACSSFCYRREGGGSSADRTKITNGKGNLEIPGRRDETGDSPPDSERSILLCRQSVNSNLLYVTMNTRYCYWNIFQSFNHT